MSISDYITLGVTIWGGLNIAASAIVAITATKKDDEILGKISKFFEYLSIFSRKAD
jgi:hypothetical protein